jgi:hypothetical protein
MILAYPSIQLMMFGAQILWLMWSESDGARHGAIMTGIIMSGGPAPPCRPARHHAGEQEIDAPETSSRRSSSSFSPGCSP